MISKGFHELRRWVRSFGITISRSQREQLEAYIAELRTWQKKINLTGLDAEDRIIRELLLDSLLPVACLPQTGTLLDLGSGAGFPAIPLKICLPDLQVHLLEPRAKRGVFLRHIIRILALHGISVLPSRIEQSGTAIDRQRYEIITARAVASLPQVIEWCGPYLAEKGMLVSFQGDSWEKMLKESGNALNKQQLRLAEALSYVLPGKTRKRAILFFARRNTPLRKSGG